MVVWIVGYNVQTAVDTEHHLIIAHEVTNSGSDRAQLANMGKRAKAVLGVEKVEAVADRGYYGGEEIKACEDAGIAVTLPKPLTSGMEANGKLGKSDFVYLADVDAYRCPAGEALVYHSATVDAGRAIRRYYTSACKSCPLKPRCTTAKNRVISRWEHEHVMEAAQKRLDADPQAMRRRRETVEHPFGTLKMRMGATHFLMKRLPQVATEMALHVLAYNLMRVMNIVGVQPLIAAIKSEGEFVRVVPKGGMVRPERCRDARRSVSEVSIGKTCYFTRASATGDRINPSIRVFTQPRPIVDRWSS